MSTNVSRIELQGKEVVLIATAHVSKESVEEVKAVIEEEQPDSVCVELCKSRFETIKNKDNWEDTNIYKVIKQGKIPVLLSNILISSYQKKMAKEMGVEVGQEMIQGIESAEDIGARLVLADRDIKVTLSRIWHSLGFKGKIKLFYKIVLSIFDDEEEEMSEEKLQELKNEDVLATLLNELKEDFPDLANSLVTERDKYLSHKIKRAPGKKVVAVLGAAHVPGIKEEIHNRQDMRELKKMPPKKNTGKYIGWGITIAILSLIMITFAQDSAAGMDQISKWILWNGAFSALGAIIATAHPLSILVAFLVAPISSLNPLLAAGWFAGVTEAFIRKPSVKDFKELSDSVTSISGLWKNKVTRVLLVVMFCNIGSTLGTLIGGTEVVRVFLDTIF